MVSRSPPHLCPPSKQKQSRPAAPTQIEPKRALIWAERAQAIPPHSETRVSVFSSKGLSLGLALPKSSGGRALLPCPILRRLPFLLSRHLSVGSFLLGTYGFHLIIFPDLMRVYAFHFFPIWLPERGGNHYLLSRLIQLSYKTSLSP
jgi:hypothetical protein